VLLSSIAYFLLTNHAQGLATTSPQKRRDPPPHCASGKERWKTQKIQKTKNKICSKREIFPASSSSSSSSSSNVAAAGAAFRGEEKEREIYHLCFVVSIIRSHTTNNERRQARRTRRRLLTTTKLENQHIQKCFRSEEANRRLRQRIYSERKFARRREK
jgi:hypothetical protein